MSLGGIDMRRPPRPSVTKADRWRFFVYGRRLYKVKGQGLPKKVSDMDVYGKEEYFNYRGE